jgi:hypothetical protein
MEKQGVRERERSRKLEGEATSSAFFSTTLCAAIVSAF